MRYISYSIFTETLFILKEEKYLAGFILAIVLISFPHPGFSQDTINMSNQNIVADTVIQTVDTIPGKKVHSPKKAALLSLVPGLGQAYNKKYWKIPVIYAGLGFFSYFAVYNQKYYADYRDAYYHSYRNDGSPPVNEYEEKYPQSFLADAKNYYRRNRDLNYILMGLWYILNMVDAAVDAHLMTWNVSDDLSVNVEPGFYSNPVSQKPYGGIKLTLNIK